jgi:dTDP-4-amino-4,6-dideoxygalactose transaminase
MVLAQNIEFPRIQTRYTADEVAELADVIRTAETYSMGPQLAALESAFADYLGVEYAVGVSSCTAALELVATELQLQPGDEVIIPAHTFTSSALPFLRRGCRLVWAEICPDAWVMDPSDVQRKVTQRTRAIVAVHLYGRPVEMNPLVELAARHDLALVEDCAQAPGATYRGRKVGTIGDFGCFSFHSQKHVCALGEGGLLVTRSARAHERVLGLRKIGSRPYGPRERYWVPAMSNVVEAVPGELPFNFALGEVQAAAARLTLRRLDATNRRRHEQAGFLRDRLRAFPDLRFQDIPHHMESAYHLLPASYTAPGRSRDDLIELLFTRYGIQCAVQFYPLYNYELFRRNGYTEHTCPISDAFFDSMISIPFWTDMEDDTLHYLGDSLARALESLRR